MDALISILMDRRDSTPKTNPNTPSATTTSISVNPDFRLEKLTFLPLHLDEQIFIIPIITIAYFIILITKTYFYHQAQHNHRAKKLGLGCKKSFSSLGDGYITLFNLIP